MVLEMILLQLLVVKGEAKDQSQYKSSKGKKHRMVSDLLAMVEEIVRHIVADISKDTTTVYHHSRVPIVGENGMG